MVTKQEYYNNAFIQEFLCSQLNNRECVFLKKIEDDKKYNNNVRCIKAFMPKYLLKNFERFEFLDRDYNIYHSLSIYKNMPMFSFNINDRMEQQRVYNVQLDEDYNNDKKELISGYDFAIDIDADDMIAALDAARKVKAIFDDYKLPYTLKASGYKGFHFNIPSRFWMPDKSIKEKYEMNFNIANNLKEAFMIDEIDLKGIYSYRRIWKVALSWDVVSDLIAVPLTDEMFDNFSLDLCKPEYILANLKVFKQDMFIRNGNLNNIDGFIKDYGTN